MGIPIIVLLFVCIGAGQVTYASAYDINPFAAMLSVVVALPFMIAVIFRLLGLD